ncbi:MAG: selenocysteine-specific translation elongation factor [bacterium]
MPETNRHYILGTAGHIDHGKTALVQALTGVDTDRLKEEKARGLTIDLGFAHFGEQATIIDVPGHEKFIKNMVAGVSTIDLVLFVVAADDGVMPQTRVHLDILSILQVKSGIIVITKKDMVEDDWLELVKEDIRELAQGTLLADAEMVAVSSITGDGIKNLREKIQAHFAKLPQRHNRGVFWLPVDRNFIMKGFGTVATGSVLSGQVRAGDFVDILPHEKKVRVRGIQKHNKSAELAQPGDRAAINMQGIAREEIARGDVLASPGFFKATARIHCRLQLLKNTREIKANTRVRLHIGTAEIMARVKPIGQTKIEPGMSAYAQFNLESKAAARRLDPFVIRQYSPAKTIGGGIVLDANAPPYRRKDSQPLDRLRGLEKEDPAELITEQFFSAPTGTLTADDLVSKTGMASDTVKPLLEQLKADGEVLAISKKSFIHKTRLAGLQQQIIVFLDGYHAQNPASPGFRKAELSQKLPGALPQQVLQFAIEGMKKDGQIREFDGFLARTTHQIRLDPALAGAKDRTEKLLHEQTYTPGSPRELAATLRISEKDIQTALDVLLAEGKITRFESDVFMHRQRVDEAQKRLISHLKQNGQITVPEFKTLIDGASRKFALPLLNYFDSLEITLREGDVRYPGAGIGEN